MLIFLFLCQIVNINNLLNFDSHLISMNQLQFNSEFIKKIQVIYRIGFRKSSYGPNVRKMVLLSVIWHHKGILYYFTVINSSFFKYFNIK